MSEFLTLDQRVDVLTGRVNALEDKMRLLTGELSGNWQPPFVAEIMRQRDPRWAAAHYGNASAPAASTIGTYGCLLTDLCYVANVLHQRNQWRPDAANAAVAAVGGFVNGNRIAFALTCQVLELKFVNLIATAGPVTAGQFATLDRHLATVGPVIVKVDNSPAAGVQEHWVTIVRKDGYGYQIADPWYPDAGTVPLCPRYPQNADVPKDAAHAIEAILLVSALVSAA